MYLLTKLVLGMSFIAALAHSDQPDSEMATASMVGASHVSPIFFDPGIKALTKQEKAELQAFITNVRETQKIDSVNVLAWADREYPTKKEQVASPRQVALADARAAAIKKFLQEDLKIAKVEVHNMAERPSKMSELFKTSDYEVKKSAEATGAAPTKPKAGFFEEMGRATTGLVLVTSTDIDPTKTKNEFSPSPEAGSSAKRGTSFPSISTFSVNIFAGRDHICPMGFS